jgi:RIO kinase 1
MQDAGLPLAKLCAAYQQLVCIVRKLYQECRLVHADLSEYNILVHKVREGPCYSQGFATALCAW